LTSVRCDRPFQGGAIEILRARRRPSVDTRCSQLNGAKPPVAESSSAAA
jgi:hypothetical protein